MSEDPNRQQKHTIRELFTRIAVHYDQVNRVLSLGQDQRWRKAALDVAALPPGGRLLDVATGTGDMALLALRERGSADVRPRIIGADLTPAMLKLAARKGGLPWVVSDGLALAFADDSFDAVTSAFMMRNVPDVAQAMAEQRRVVKPGGRVVCLEMTWPQRLPMRWLFGLYFFTVPPLVGKLATGEEEAYRYLPRSVKEFIDPETLARKMEQVGLRDVTWARRMLGTVVIHVGRK
ncbi:MAG: ubiquinone/menaquinone biosynthesis methyltransferase [Anaerolineae bacterium]